MAENQLLRDINAVAGNTPSLSVVHKFGRADVGTSFVPVALGNNYRTPQVAGATALRVKSGGNANDTAAGSGAREVTLYGLDETGAEVEEAIATAGASASSATTTTFLRLFRVIVSASGTYATQSSGSHSADITIENSAGTEDWAVVSSSGFPRGQSEIGVYTIPLGKTGYVKSIHISGDSTKTYDWILFKREGILETSAPYKAMRQMISEVGISGEVDYHPETPLGPLPALTDVGFLAKVPSSTGNIEVDFEILLVG